MAARANGVALDRLATVLGHRFGDPALLDQPMVSAAVEREGIPYTEFKYAENTGQFQVIKEQTGTFSDSIKLWGNE